MHGRKLISRLKGNVYLVYRSKRKEYRLKLSEFFNQLEVDKIIKLSHAAESDEKLFWKLIKGQRSSSQMTAFLVNDTLLTDRGKIRQIWADHFETLGTPSVNDNFDSNFCAIHVREAFHSCMNDPVILLVSCVSHLGMKKLSLSVLL